MNRNRWYNYLIGGVIALLLIYSLTKAFWPLFGIFLNKKDDISYFIGVNLTFIPIIISISVVILIYHKLVIKRVAFKRIFIGFIIWTILQLIPLLFSVVFSKETLIYNYNPNKFYIFILLSLLLTPIQIAAEEFIFRGYLISGLKSLNKGNLFPLILSSILFALPHMGNPEVKEQKIIYFLIYMTMALLLGYLTIKYGGIEYALGIHFANNFFAINILNYPDSPLPSSPLFILNGSIEPIPALIQSFILSIIITVFIKIIETKSVQRQKK